MGTNYQLVKSLFVDVNDYTETVLLEARRHAKDPYN